MAQFLGLMAASPTLGSIEALMGLTVHGHWRGARQRPGLPKDSVRTVRYAAYNDEGVADDSRGNNFVAYVATGLWHYFLITGQRDVLQKFWPMVDRAITVVLHQQADGGQIYWAVDTKQGPNKDA